MTIPNRQPYVLPEDLERGGALLLHVCCAPCSCEIIEGLLASKLKPTVFFYNPNIHPEKEYDIRKQEVVRFCAERDVPVIDGDYDTDNWFACVKGLEKEPEKGRRCDACFLLRMDRTALMAKEKGIAFFATSLSISRHKDQKQVHTAAIKAAETVDGVQFWPYNWRQKGGADRGAVMAKQLDFYRQNYCGCVFSRRDKVNKT